MTTGNMFTFSNGLEQMEGEGRSLRESGHGKDSSLQQSWTRVLEDESFLSGQNHVQFADVSEPGLGSSAEGLHGACNSVGFSVFPCWFYGELLKSCFLFSFSLLLLKRIYHYWKYVAHLFQGTNQHMENCFFVPFRYFPW